MALPLRAEGQQGIFPMMGKAVNDFRESYRPDFKAIRGVVCLGTMMVLSWFVSINLLVVPLSGFYLVVRGVELRNGKLLLPGGLLSGFGLAFLFTSPPFCPANGDLASSLFLFTCALGLFSVCLLSRIYTRHPQWWPLLPGSMMALTSFILVVS